MGMAGVASTLLNRAASGKYGGHNVTGVALAPNQYQAWQAAPGKLYGLTPQDPAYQRAGQIFDGLASGAIADPTNGATHYYAPAAQAAAGNAPPSWAKGPGVSVGNSLFYAPQGAVHYQPAGAPQSAKGAPASAAEPDYTQGFDVGGDAESAPALTIPNRNAVQPQAAASAASEPDYTQGFDISPGPASAPSPAASPSPIGVNDAVRATATGIPIIGGLLNAADAATDAALAPLFNRFYDPQDQLQGESFGERYTNALAEQNGMDTAFQQAHPVANAILGTAGAVGGTVPAMMAAPGLFGAGEGGLLVNSGVSALTGAGMGGADALVRSGGNLGSGLQGAETGAAFGAAAPGIGRFVGSGIGAIGNILSGVNPAARFIGNALHEIGMAPADVQQTIQRMGPQASLADVDPALSDLAGAVASRGGAPTSILKNFATERGAAGDDRMSQIVDQTLGPKPDALQILEDIRYREGYGQLNPALAKSALDSAMGAAADPYTQLQSMMKARTAAAAPIYKEALSNPVIWDKRLQQFLDDPIVQDGLSKGVAIQRMESLANNEPFEPNDYVYKGKGTANDPVTGRFVSAPIIGEAPNFKTLDVMKKGLDGIVQDNQDPITGKLSQYGVAVDKVRSTFVDKLDDINPDYAAARQAWAGPTVTHDAFNRGLNIFRNQAGSSGINTTPGALSAWMAKASDGEKDAVQLGARTAFQQEMQSASDPVAKAAGLASKDVNQQKLAAIFGPNEAKQLSDQLNFQYTDPVGQAFSKGMDVFKNRQGVAGVEDTPDALNKWLSTASPGEQEAVRQGARQTIEQALTSARHGDLSAAQTLFSKNTANRQKLQAIFPEAGGMLDALDSELTMRATNQNIAKNSATASRTAIGAQLEPRPSSTMSAAPALIGQAMGGETGALAATAGNALLRHAAQSMAEGSMNRLKLGLAHALSANGAPLQDFMGQLGRAYSTNALHGVISHAAAGVTNLLSRSAPMAINGNNGAPILTIPNRNALQPQQ